MAGARAYFFYERRNGNVPKELVALCLGMDGLIQNYPQGVKAKAILKKTEYGRIHKALEKLRDRYSLDEMVGTAKFARSSENIYLFKLKSQNHPRIYFTDYFSDKYVLLHGLKKKQYEEDPEDLALARERLEDLLDRES